VTIGQEDPGTASLTVRAEDLVTGVYEIDVIAPPLASATATVRADLGPVALAATAQGLEASAFSAGVTGEVLYRLVGAERSFVIAGRGQPAESLQVQAPRWARHMEVDVQLPAELWDEMTDFAVTVYDSTGQQIPGGNQPVNYAFGRMSVALTDSLTGRPLTIELFPAFARLPGHSWRGNVKVRFLGPDEPAGEGGQVSVVAGGRTIVRPPTPPPLQLPEGFSTLIETRVTTLTGTMAVRRMTVPTGARGASGIR
jgi:FAD/FMN-containing dehydrogenase